MMFIYGMISFVTNLAAPMGNVWKYQPGIDGSNMLGMMGNMMNFLAYVFMGIPAGRMLTNCGYKKTAMIGIAKRPTVTLSSRSSSILPALSCAASRSAC